jgi:phosphoribosylglycinamide formyltransferase-1
VGAVNWLRVQRYEMQTNAIKETFVGGGIVPEDMSFDVSAMATGRPGLPRRFSWKGRSFVVGQVLEEWTECGNCRHGSGERYLRKHWFRVRTTEDIEMRIYFERQARSSGGSRWRLYSLRRAEAGTPSNAVPAA